MKKYIFALAVAIQFLGKVNGQFYPLTLSLLKPTVGSKSAVVSASGSGIVSSTSFISVIYGEKSNDLNKTKQAGVAFGGPGVIIISGAVFSTTLDSLKEKTKYYYKYVVNDSYQGINNKLTKLDSFTTTKEPYILSLTNDKIHDSLKSGAFVSRISTNALGNTVYTIDPKILDNQYFFLKNDSLFTSSLLSGIKKNALNIQLDCAFADTSSASTNFTLNLIDKTPPVIIIKSDTLKRYIGVVTSFSLSYTDFDNGSYDVKTNIQLSLSKNAFDCENVGLNKIQFLAKDDSLNIATRDVYLQLLDTVKPVLYTIKEKTLYLDSLGVAKLKPAEIEVAKPIPDSIYSKNLKGYYLMDSGKLKNTIDTSFNVSASGIKFAFDRCLNKNTAISFNGVDQFLDLGKNAAFVNSVTSQTISLWAKMPYAPTQLNGFGAYQDYNGHRYFKSTSTVSWKRAKAICDSLKGYLVIPNTSAENSFLKTLAGGSLTWIGVSDEISENKFYTVNGDTIRYSNWRSGQPDNFNNEDYIHLDANGLWNDGPDDYNLNFIIEFDINSGVFLAKYQNLDAGNSYFYVSPQSVSGNGTNSISFSNVVIDSNWNHFTYVLESGSNKTRVYMNGSLIALGSLNYNTKTASLDQTTVTVGRVSGSPSNYFTGSIDDLRVYNGAMSQDSIISLFNFERLCKPDRVYKTSDNCTISQKLLSQDNFGCADLGTKFISYSIIDKGGNRVDSTINLTIRDTIKPIIMVKEATLRVDSTSSFKLVYTDIDNGSTDNCAINTRTLSKNEYFLKDTGTVAVLYTVSDKSNNSTSKEVKFKLLCKDPEPPTDQVLSICQGEQTSLKASVPQGSNGTLVWYSSAVGGTGTQAPPSPNPINTNTLEYYVTHRYAGCESTKRAKITVNVKPQPSKPTIQRDSTGFLVSSATLGNVWIKDGVVLNDTIQRFKPLATGNYQVKSFVNGCANISNSYYYLTTGFLNNSSNNDFKVSPSPFKDAFVLTFAENSIRNRDLSIFNISDSRLVFSTKSVKSGIRVDLSKYPSGTYLVKISSADGKTMLQRKIIKL